MKSKIQNTLELLSSLNISFIVEGIPLFKDKIIEMKTINRLPLEKQLDIIAGYYGYTVLRESNGRRQYNDVAVFQKSFKDKKDVPDVSFEEMMPCHKDIKQFLNRYDNSVISDIKKFQTDFYESIDKSEIDAFKKGISIKNINQQQQNKIKKFVSHVAIHGLLEEFDGVDNFQKIDGIAKNNQGVAEFQVSHQNSGVSVKNYCQEGSNILNITEVSASFETEHNTLYEIVKICQEKWDVKINIDNFLVEKPLLYISNGKTLPEKLLVSVSKAYGLIFSYNKISKKCSISRKKINYVYNNIYDCIVSGLPDSLLRFMDRDSNEQKFNKLSKNNMPQNLIKLPKTSLSRFEFGIDKALIKNKMIGMKQMDYVTKSALTVSAYSDFLFALMSFKYDNKKAYLSNLDNITVVCERLSFQTDINGPAIAVSVSIPNGSMVRIKTLYK
jgi:hypothetical protein